VLARFITLTARDRTLLLVGLLWVLMARLALLWPAGSFDRKQRILDVLSSRLLCIHLRAVDDAAWAVSAVARRVPGARCLAWALALRGLLRQAGVAAELQIGVAVGSHAGALKAHAWLVCDGRTLSWGDDIKGYRPLRPSAVVS
jgi:hypothetical protein